MNYSLAKISHQKTKEKYRPGFERPTDASVWPEEWKTIYFKEYPRLPRIVLPRPGSLKNSSTSKRTKCSLTEALLKRKSGREFKGKSLGLQQLNQLLFYSAGIIEKKEKDWNVSRRTYPSAGGRFPLELYLFSLQTGTELKQGIYHYNVKEHSLEKLLEEKNLRKIIYPEIIWQDMIHKAPLVLVISAVLERTMMKYQDRGYRYVLFEAGHLGQNVSLICAALGLKCCALGGFDDNKFCELLDIDGESEVVLYAFALGY